MKRILITGINGQVGHALVQRLQHQYDVIAVDRAMMDLTDVETIRHIIRDHSPDYIINPAAYTAVDQAESEQGLAFAINGEAPGIMAEEAAKKGAAMIHFSTDYVFDGQKSAPYLETDQVNPLGVYGKSKLAGEEAILQSDANALILRTSWVYSDYGKNFLKTILRLASERDQLRVVGDQWGAPTSAYSIAAGVESLLKSWDPAEKSLKGIYHFTNAGRTSWFGFAKAILEQYSGIAKENTLPVLKVSPENIQAITTQEYPTPAKRPVNSCLSNHKLHSTFHIELPSWEIALMDVMQRMFKS